MQATSFVDIAPEKNMIKSYFICSPMLNTGKSIDVHGANSLIRFNDIIFSTSTIRSPGVGLPFTVNLVFIIQNQSQNLPLIFSPCFSVTSEQIRR